MIDGHYSIEINTSLGPQQGTADIETDGDVMYADIDAPVIGSQKAKGKVDGNKFVAKGTLDLLLFGEVKYKLRGEVDGDDLHIVIESSRGEFHLEGTRD